MWPRALDNDLEGLAALRETVRDAASGRGTPAESQAVAALDRIAAAHPIIVRLSAAPLPFEPAGSGIERFVERLLGIMAASVIDGKWERLRACPNDRCRWLFYDHSRNRSRTWCSMDLCGAQAKMRAYRARRHAEGSLTAGSRRS